MQLASMERIRANMVAASSGVVCSSFGLSGAGAGVYYGGPLEINCRQSHDPPVHELELLPMKSSHNSSETSTPAPSSVTNPGSSFSWQPQQQGALAASRTNSAGEAGEVGTSGSRGGSPRAVQFDMNRLPSTTDCDEEAVVTSASPSSNITGMKRGRTAAAGGGSDDEDGGNTRKKLRLSKEQSLLLEESFKDHSTLNPKQKIALAKQLCLRPRQVEVWFQNRRARTKLKQTEVDCEALKRCCKDLTEENRRLQKELQELRALKLAPPTCVISHDVYMAPLPAATLTMCPSCARVATVDNRAAAHTAFSKATAFSSHFSQSSAACT
ncbi:unnamed protein product [Sphagnum compactum]